MDPITEVGSAPTNTPERDIPSDGLLIIEAAEVAGAHGHGIRVACHPVAECGETWGKSGENLGKMWEDDGKCGGKNKVSQRN